MMNDVKTLDLSEGLQRNESWNCGCERITITDKSRCNVYITINYSCIYGVIHPLGSSDRLTEVTVVAEAAREWIRLAQNNQKLIEALRPFTECQNPVPVMPQTGIRQTSASCQECVGCYAAKVLSEIEEHNA